MSFRFLLPIEREIIPKFIELPIGDEDMEEIMNVEEYFVYPEESIDNVTILVVEDITDMRKYISFILQDCYKILEAASGVWFISH